MLFYTYTGTKVSITVLRKAYLSIQEAVQDSHHKTLQRHSRTKYETKTDTSIAQKIAC